MPDGSGVGSTSLGDIVANYQQQQIHTDTTNCSRDDGEPQQYCGGSSEIPTDDSSAAAALSSLANYRGGNPMGM